MSVVLNPTAASAVAASNLAPSSAAREGATAPDLPGAEPTRPESASAMLTTSRIIFPVASGPLAVREGAHETTSLATWNVRVQADVAVLAHASQPARLPLMLHADGPDGP